VDAELKREENIKSFNINNYLISRGREDVTLVSLSLLAGIFFDYLFYGKELGLSYPVFVGFFLIIFFWLEKKKIKILNLKLVLLVPILLLSLTFFIFSNSFLAGLNFFIIPILIIGQTVLITENNNNQWYKLKFINDLAFNAIYKTFNNILKPVKIAFLTLKVYFPELSSDKYSALKKIITGFIIAFPLLITVIVLLASADSIFNNSIESIGTILGRINLADSIPHLILIGMVSLIISGYLWSLVNSKKIEKVAFEPSVSAIKWDPVITSTVLFLVDLVYILFSVIQFSYLFGGAASNPLPSFSYSEYARRGFFELVVVTLINLSILVSSINFVKKENKFTTNIVRFLLTIMIFSTGVMLYSAHFRMAIYEEVFGYTYLRLYVHVFMLMLFIWFLLSFYRVWKDGIQLAKLFLISALTVYTFLNYLNVDYLIAGNNVDRYQKTGKIDILYLEELSNDAIPHLLRLGKLSTNPNINNSLKNYLKDKRLKLNEESPWQSFNISRERARNLLMANSKW
jgi:hypothetical protein